MAFDACLNCGICYDNCLLEQMGFTAFVSLPFRNDASGLWICCNCWSCQECCPAGLPLMSLKWSLQRAENTPAQLMEAFNLIQKCGYCLPVEQEDLNPIRTEIGLEPISIPSAAIITILLE
jgi:heterodisulfide reductase subunit C2